MRLKSIGTAAAMVALGACFGLDVPFDQSFVFNFSETNVGSASSTVSKTVDLSTKEKLKEHKDKIKDCALDTLTYQLSDVQTGGGDVVIGGTIYLNACSDGTAGEVAEGTPATVAGDPIEIAIIPERAVENMASPATLELSEASVAEIVTVAKRLGLLTICAEYYLIGSTLVESVSGTLTIEVAGSCEAGI